MKSPVQARRRAVVFALSLAAFGARADMIGEQSPASLPASIPRDEIWVNSDVIRDYPPENPAELLNGLDAVFTGTLDSVAPEFVDAERKKLYTRLTFKPREQFVGERVPASTRLDTWRVGGTYVNTAIGPKPRRPVDFAETLVEDAMYFVSAKVTGAAEPLGGRLEVVDIVPLERSGSVKVHSALNTAWVSRVRTLGRSRQGAGNLDDAAAFMAGLREVISLAGRGTPRR